MNLQKRSNNLISVGWTVKRLLCLVLVAALVGTAAWVAFFKSTGEFRVDDDDMAAQDAVVVSHDSSRTFFSPLEGRSSSSSSQRKVQQRGGTTTLPMHFITVQTSAAPLWCRMLLSAYLSGNITVTNLAWGAKYSHIKRPQWILQYLQPLDDSDVVMFADGGDTIYTGFDATHIYRTFANATSADEEEHHKRYKNGLGSADVHPVLFNAEANCYHQQTFDGSWGVKKGKCLSAYKRYNPNTTSPYRYLNGGAWIARVWAAKKVFRAAQEIIQKDNKHWWCDQSVFGKLLLGATMRSVLGLDMQNRFFLPTYHLRASRDLCSKRDEAQRLSEVTTAHGTVAAAVPLLRMCHSGQIPSVVHFNGKSEGRFTSEIIQRTLWHVRSSRGEISGLVEHAKEHAVVLLGHHQERKKLKDVCPVITFPSYAYSVAHYVIDF